MTGCGANRAWQFQQTAAERQGAAEAKAQPAEQPEECRRDWPLLGRSDLVGRGQLTGIGLYEAYITDTINPAKHRCWQFNEDRVDSADAGAK